MARRYRRALLLDCSHNRCNLLHWRGSRLWSGLDNFRRGLWGRLLLDFHHFGRRLLFNCSRFWPSNGWFCGHNRYRRRCGLRDDNRCRRYVHYRFLDRSDRRRNFHSFRGNNGLLDFRGRRRMHSLCRSYRLGWSRRIDWDGSWGRGGNWRDGLEGDRSPGGVKRHRAGCRSGQARYLCRILCGHVRACAGVVREDQGRCTCAKRQNAAH